jgi:uncharacterized protein
MFKINLGSFDDRQEFTFELKKSDVSFEEISYEDGMYISVTLTKDSEGSVVAEGHIEGMVLLTCGRCLEEIKLPIDTDFVTIYKEKSSITEEDEEADVLPYDRNILDLTECLRDTLLLEIPLKPICDEKCLGLCPVCGANQNKEKCGCDKTIKIDDTFKPFEKLDL